MRAGIASAMGAPSDGVGLGGYRGPKREHEAATMPRAATAARDAMRTPFTASR